VREATASDGAAGGAFAAACSAWMDRSFDVNAARAALGSVDPTARGPQDAFASTTAVASDIAIVLGKDSLVLIVQLHSNGRRACARK
jgi:hypothetical protein